MKITLNIEEELLDRAAQLTGVKAKTHLVRLALQVLVSSESARRLARLGASEPQLGQVRRRRGGKETGARSSTRAFSGDDLKYWLSRTPEERIEAMEILRRMRWGDAVDQPIARVVKRRNRKDPDD